jgi:hypothetical protein
MTTEDREREFSRRALLRAGWSVPLALGVGGLAAACGGGGDHEDLGKEILDLTRENQRKNRGKARSSTTSTSTSSTSTTTTTTPGSSTTATTRSATGTPQSPHVDGPRNTTRVHTDVPHGDSGAVASPHTDQHGDVPESTHDDILAYERGEGPRFVTTPHVDTPHADVPHVDAPHTDIAHGDT